MDYQGLYEDLLEMGRRAKAAGYHDLYRECFEFQVELLMRFKTFVATVWI